MSQERIRIAYFLDSFEIGGTELNAVRTAEALDRDEFELSVLHLHADGPLRSRYEKLGLRMTHLPISNLYSPRSVVQGFRIARLLRQWNVDVVHSHDIYCNIFAVPWARMFSGCSTIASRRWWYDAPRPELVTVNRWSYRLAHRVLANSGGVAELLAREEGVPARKIVEIPNFLSESACDTADEVQCAAQRRAWGLSAGSFAIGIVARLSPVKNHVMLFNALAQLEARFHLIVIGNGPLRARLGELANNLGIGSRIHFAGEIVSPRNLHRFFDVSVLCSSSEGFPNAVIEAMAAARPVVATSVGGVPDVLKDNVTGLLVPVDSAVALADALRKLEADSSMKWRLGEAGREAVRTKFSQKTVIEKLSKLYRFLASQR